MTDPTQEHHKGLKYAGLRDHIAEQLRSNPNVRISVHCDSDAARENFREHLEESLRKAKEALSAFHRGTSYRAVMQANGWDDYDVSDRVRYDPETYLSFIGTEEEFEKCYPEARTEE